MINFLKDKKLGYVITLEGLTFKTFSYQMFKHQTSTLITTLTHTTAYLNEHTHM